jgi:hypothetical protein
MPVLSCVTMPATFRDRRSYSRRVCLPGNAVSTLLECLPTFSGKDLACRRACDLTFRKLCDPVITVDKWRLDFQHMTGSR